MVRVRNFEQRDQHDVMRIWVKGLDQTIDESSWYLSMIFKLAFKRIKARCTAPDGDMANIFKTYCRPGLSQCFVAVDETDEVIGCVIVKRGRGEEISEADRTSKETSIIRMSVDKAHRRRGVGKALLEACEEYSKVENVNTVVLTTANPAGIIFYKSLGFVTESTFFNGVGENMIKRLSER
eukprot:CFRG2404T1